MSADRFPRAGAVLARARVSALNILFPPLCLSCAEPVAENGRLCGDCWNAITFIAGPLCDRCGVPLEFDPGPGSLCGACHRDPPVFDRARSVMVYDAHSRGLVLKFKHADRTHGAPAYGAWLARAGAELLADADLLIPVPLHRWRLARRRYNQAALLAHGISGGPPVATDILRRVRTTRSQGGLGAAARLRNVLGAFAVDRRHRPRLAGRRVLLIDDVMTTGATVSVCARTLLAAGASAVDVLALARVVRPEDRHI